MLAVGDLFEKSMQDLTFLKKIITTVHLQPGDVDAVIRVAHSVSLTKEITSHQIQGKVMLMAFFDIEGLVHHEFIPPGQSGTVLFYVQVLQRLHDAVRRTLRDRQEAGTVVPTSR
jgi:hypothetical protein